MNLLLNTKSCSSKYQINNTKFQNNNQCNVAFLGKSYPDSFITTHKGNDSSGAVSVIKEELKEKVAEPVNTIKKHHKIKHPFKKLGVLALATTGFFIYGDVKEAAKDDLSLQHIEDNVQKVQLNLKFETADLVYDINNIMDGKKLAEDNVNLYMTHLNSDKEEVFYSEDTAQMMDVLAIASVSDVTKDQVKSETLKPYLVKALQYENGGILNESSDAVTGEGEPWYYIAAAIVSKYNPELADHMPQDERKALEDKNFFENLWNDIQITAGKGEQVKQYLGDILENRDYEYSYGILSADNNWPKEPSDNSWFGPLSVGYAIRGGLDNLKGMSLADIENFRVDYAVNRDNQKKFAENEDYSKKVVSSYIVKYMRDAITDKSGKVNSGLSALGLQEAGLMDDNMLNTLLEQITEEAPKVHWFTNETQKLDAAIKVEVLERAGMYDKLSVDTRKAIRKFQVDNPKSAATSVFVLAEESYWREYYTNIIAKREPVQNTLQSLIEVANKNSEKDLKPTDQIKNLDDILIKASELKLYNSKILSFVDKELKIAEAAEDAPTKEGLTNMKTALTKQNSDIENWVSNIYTYEASLAQQIDNEYNNKIDKIVNKVDQSQIFESKKEPEETFVDKVNGAIDNARDTVSGVIGGVVDKVTKKIADMAVDEATDSVIDKIKD